MLVTLLGELSCIFSRIIKRSSPPWKPPGRGFITVPHPLRPPRSLSKSPVLHFHAHIRRGVIRLPVFTHRRRLAVDDLIAAKIRGVARGGGDVVDVPVTGYTLLLCTASYNICIRDDVLIVVVIVGLYIIL